jgi:hypothetical protein
MSMSFSANLPLRGLGTLDSAGFTKVWSPFHAQLLNSTLCLDPVTAGSGLFLCLKSKDRSLRQLLQGNGEYQ